MGDEGRGALFEGITFTIIPSDTLGDPDRIIRELEAQGGRYIPLRTSDQQIANLGDVTHIISTHIDFPQYNSAVEIGKHVVKPSWAQHSVKKGKLSAARQHSPDPNQFFQDVVLTVAGLPEGDKDAIIAGVMALGGQYSNPLSKLVTHIVASDESHEKVALAQQKKLNCKIVLPHWFDDCFRLGKKINEKPYMFPNPPYLQSGVGRPDPEDSVHVTGATGAMPKGLPSGPLPDTPPSSPSDARKNFNAFMGKQVMISADLGLGKHLVETLEALINHGGGTLTDEVEDADIYIGQYRDGEDYLTASRARKEVANLSWLYHVINQNKYTNPLSKLLHYPIPRGGIPGFEHMRVSISNYNGDARLYLENLIGYCGAEFTKTMKQDNTHLITAHTRSEKCEAAMEWNINLINHLWIEESYAKCAPQSLTIPKYTHFPDKTHLGEVVGQTSLDMKRVEQVYFPKPRESPQKATQPAPTQAKASPRKTVPASSAVTTKGTPRGKLQQTAPTPIAEDEETEGEQEEEPQTAKKGRGRPRKSVTATPRLLDEEKENQSPLYTGSGRAAAKKANDRLSVNMADKNNYDKESKRKGGVIYGGRRSSHLEDFSSPAPASKRPPKRKSDEGTYDVTAVDSDLSDGETQDRPGKAAKKAKHAAASSDLPPVDYKMMITGDERWIGNPKQEGADKTKLRMLGVQLTQDAENVDILVAPRILRTRKFVAALASAPLVVDTKYLDSALKQNKLMDKPSLLRDRDTEERLGFKLTDALDRAKVNQRKLLRGWSIFVTKDIPGGFETYKEIITLNGGDAYMYAGRTGLAMPKRRLRDDPDAGSESQHQGGDEEYDYIYLVSGVSDPEIKLWKQFRSTAEKQDVQARIVRTDWLLNAAMRQEVTWEDKWDLDEASVLSQRKG
ncbi:hypothetical protein LTR85_003388 [Meristemomyces frigidus]|nr:hypothetical protein LTR85_003388 [Meristemomyces frigidus]